MTKTKLKTKPTRGSAAAFIDRQRDPELRADCKKLATIMRSASGANAKMWGPNLVGYGRYSYQYTTGHEGEFFLTGFSPRPGQITVYILAGFGGCDRLLRLLGKHKRTKACLYIKRLDDVDLVVLKTLIEKSVRALRARHKALA